MQLKYGRVQMFSLLQAVLKDVKYIERVVDCRFGMERVRTKQSNPNRYIIY